MPFFNVVVFEGPKQASALLIRTYVGPTINPYPTP